MEQGSPKTCANCSRHAEIFGESRRKIAFLLEGSCGRRFFAGDLRIVRLSLRRKTGKKLSYKKSAFIISGSVNERQIFYITYETNFPHSFGAPPGYEEANRIIEKNRMK